MVQRQNGKANLGGKKLQYLDNRTHILYRVLIKVAVHAIEDVEHDKLDAMLNDGVYQPANVLVIVEIEVGAVCKLHPVVGQGRIAVAGVYLQYPLLNPEGRVLTGQVQRLGP